VELEEPAPVDRIVLVLAGVRTAPASFRVPGGFERSGTDEVQHFVLLEYTSDESVEIAPTELTGDASQTDADLRILVAR
jgi:hypothetical protein